MLENDLKFSGPYAGAGIHMVLLLSLSLSVCVCVCVYKGGEVDPMLGLLPHP